VTILTKQLPNQYPDDSVPENKLQICPDLFSQPFYRSYLLSGVYLQVLAAHFSDSENIEDEVVRQKIRQSPYRDDDRTGILLKTVSDWSPTTTEIRPAVLINRGEVQVIRRGIGDHVGDDYITGQSQYSVELAGSHVLFAIARTAAEADRVGIEVSRLLIAVRAILLDQLDLSTLQLTSIGEASRLEESKDHYAVPIVIAYHLTESYVIQPHVPVLKRLVFRTQ
jgi:hypothetical protein